MRSDSFNRARGDDEDFCGGIKDQMRWLPASKKSKKQKEPGQSRPEVHPAPR
jgi:hypothetical protein